MRNELEKYIKGKAENLPSLTIKFCCDRAVITIKKQYETPRRHYNVYFGLLFWVKIMIGLFKVYNQEIKNKDN